MIRFKILFALCITVSFTAAGQQQLQGRWYMFSRNRIIEITISKKLIVSRQLNWGLTTAGFDDAPDTQMIHTVTKKNDNIYVSVTNAADTSHETLLYTFKVIRPCKELIWVINGSSHPFTDTTAIKQYIINDTDKKYGMTLYSATEINRLKNQKKIDRMTVKDFKTYAGKILQFRARMDSLSTLPGAPANDLLYYGYSMIRVLAAETGYDPLITSNDYEKLIKRFQNNPATKETIKKLMQ